MYSRYIVDSIGIVSVLYCYSIVIRWLFILLLLLLLDTSFLCFIFALMDIVVYIIKTHYNTFYCGMTNSIIRRWKEHVNGQSKYLSFFKPKEVVFIEKWDSYKEARIRELHIKRGGVGNFYKKYLVSLSNSAI